MHVELRVTGKRVGWLFCLKLAWILAAVAVLMIGFGTCLAGETPCFEAGLTMEGFMFILSLPSSIFFVLWSPVIYGFEGIHSPAQYVLFWLGAFVVGLVQWFVLVPKLFRSKTITTLGLTTPFRSKPRRSKHRPGGRRKRESVQTRIELKPFDSEGKTPIERVFTASGK